jgi:chaperonin cofactor prefoldin
MTTDQMNAQESLRYDYERLLHRLNVIEAAHKALKIEYERLRAQLKEQDDDYHKAGGTGTHR